MRTLHKPYYCTWSRGHWFECSCGWESKQEWSYEAARIQVLDHIEETGR